MSEKVTDNSGQLETANHDLVDQDKVNNIDSNPEKQDTVLHKTHQKLLNQMKNQKSELEELRGYRRQNEENEMERKGEYDKLLKAREERINELEGKLNNFEKDRTEGKKLNAFINKLPGKIKNNDYLSFVDIESIQMDPSTGEIDKISLDHAVEKFVQNYGHDMIQSSNQKGLPNVGHLGGKPNMKRSLKDLSSDELKREYLNGNW